MARDQIDAIVGEWRVQLPDIVGPSMELGKRVHRLAGRLQEAVRNETAALGLSPAEFDVLSALRRAGPPYALKPSELASGLLLTSGGISNVLRRLQQDGLIERAADTADARVAWVRLSAAGLATAEKVVRAVTGAQARLFSAADPALVTAAADRLRELLIALGDTAKED
ncbi:MarR family winged helix-turn-helix transcriptional regulator [Dactylosporangium matsuzakiense]|uniref:MarR family transcriptional regulator n=1 Tax=Dactylosporangium matsuzakiense TaxID=53360 RepID=A0A9W6NQX3_9ACTN|nr:MarR family transcriptional regulator [Dactylosporangium matsuzakiense]UWZ43707.1 MarR family transcriptional regulator [Dactylosporangium matsuzakiense]GLL05803.1 MarR family transcriptional regulator [Dactylosporangium matsuzakiense]